jgi:hypothetical protein
MTDGDQHQKKDHNDPGNKEIVKYKPVSHRFKDGQYRPAENKYNQAGDERLELGLAKEYF